MIRHNISSLLLAGAFIVAPMSLVIAHPLDATYAPQAGVITVQGWPGAPVGPPGGPPGWSPDQGRHEHCWRLRNQAHEIRRHIRHAPPSLSAALLCSDERRQAGPRARPRRQRASGHVGRNRDLAHLPSAQSNRFTGAVSAARGPAEDDRSQTGKFIDILLELHSHLVVAAPRCVFGVESQGGAESCVGD